MKKSLKVGCGILAGCVILTSGAIVVVKVIQNNNNKDKEQNNFYQDEDDEELKEEIAHDVPDKNPEEIIIPRVPTKEEGATEEEIAEAQKQADAAEQEKEYWTVVQNVKEQLKKKIFESGVPNQDGILPSYIRNLKSVRRINDFYCDSQNNIVVDADILYTENEKLRQMKIVYTFKNSEISCDSTSLTSIMGFITDDRTESQILTRFNDYNYTTGLEEFYENHVKNKYLLKEYQNDGYQVELVDMKCSKSDGKIPTTFFCISKLTKNDETFYMAHQLNTYMVTSKMSEEEWLEFAKTTNNRDFSIQLETRLNPTNIDWKALSEEYSGQKTQEAQAQAEIEEISTRDANGKVTGMAWNESQEKVEKKKAQNAAKLASQDAAMDYMPLYSDQELSL